MKFRKQMMTIVVAALGSAATLAGAQSAQPQQGTSTQTASNQGPKTRAEVRAELARARADGSIPRFGNPDPYGPGGTPNEVGRSASHTW